MPGPYKRRVPKQNLYKVSVGKSIKNIKYEDIITDSCPKGYMDFRFSHVGNPELSLHDFNNMIPNWCIRSAIKPTNYVSSKHNDNSHLPKNPYR